MIWNLEECVRERGVSAGCSTVNKYKKECEEWDPQVKCEATPINSPISSFRESEPFSYECLLPLKINMFKVNAKAKQRSMLQRARPRGGSLAKPRRRAITKERVMCHKFILYRGYDLVHQNEIAEKLYTFLLLAFNGLSTQEAFLLSWV
ncbi:hypothetical protein VNO78_05252 [Psophocarpus tetragonolobus]|uniref:Uncharacterized protein n=1 Tax=Psophocarpus tetragonolobus TaxID=3891 RepID=A0AAN9SRZ4_PSOTE